MYLETAHLNFNEMNIENRRVNKFTSVTCDEDGKKTGLILKLDNYIYTGFLSLYLSLLCILSKGFPLCV
jgi:hypothetical protein